MKRIVILKIFLFHHLNSLIIRTILTWLDAILLLETFGEIRRSLKADHIANLRDSETMLAQEHGRLAESHLLDIIDRGEADILLDESVKLFGFEIRLFAE